jgi:RHH-type proline utilization regulon transcriptional repressor/proline dehydrogenase/delta 1-pyrroline-5-carboxylate dehydrogenase
LPETAATLAVQEVQAGLKQVPPAERVELDSTVLPGPTGESNILSTFGRGIVLCLGPTADAAAAQARIATATGCRAVQIAPGATGEYALDGQLNLADLATLDGFHAVAYWGPEQELRQARIALAGREGRLIPLLAEMDLGDRCRLERHICIDTTAAGGNASLLAEAC